MRAPWVRAASVAVGAVIAAGVVLELLFVAGHTGAIPAYRVVAFLYLLPAATAFAVVGAAVVGRLPNHPIGWLFGILAIEGAMAVLSNGYTAWDLPAGAALVWVWALARGVAYGAIGLALVVYPTGRPPSSRWRLVVRLQLAFMAISLILAAFARWQVRPYPNETSQFANPIGLVGPAGFDAFGLIDSVGAALFAVALVSLVVRWRAASGDEREQVKWMALAGLVFVAVAAIGVVVLLLRDGAPKDPAPGFLVGDAIFQLAVTMIPVAMGVGIARYRLYDIDRLISGTLAYAASAALIVAAYVAAVVVVGDVVAVGAGTSTIVALLATAVVAVAFDPLRSRLQERADRWAFGPRAVPYELMTDFARQLGQALAPADVPGRIAEAACQALRAETSRVTVWLPGERVLEGRWCADHDRGSFDVVVPVVDGGATVGEIAVAGGTRRPGDVELLGRVVEVAAAAMRNLRLLAELEHLSELVELQNRNLATSRRLLLVAADDERRHLRDTIASRVEPHLNTLRRSLAEIRFTELTDTLVADELRALVPVATTVVEEIRAVARGVLPPVLADHGLPAALRASLRSVDIDVTLYVEPSVAMSRFPSPIEAAVFLTCAAAIRDAEETEATQITIRVGCRECEIHFTAAHDGDAARGDSGADLWAVREQLAALGGELDVDEGDGLRLVGRVPAAATIRCAH